MSRHTPWGPSQTHKVLAVGITQYSTAGHGGIGLSADRWRQLLGLIPNCKPWAGEGWLEEDCDWAYAALVWPEHFEPKAIYYAVKQGLRCCKPAEGASFQLPANFFETPHGLKLMAIYEKVVAEVEGKWEVNGMGSCSCVGRCGGWGVSLFRNGEHRYLHFNDYPKQSHYSEAELSQIARPVTKAQPAQAKLELGAVALV